MTAAKKGTWIKKRRINFTAGVSGINSGVSESPGGVLGSFNYGQDNFIGSDGSDNHAYLLFINDTANQLKINIETTGGGVPIDEVFEFLLVPAISPEPFLAEDAIIVIGVDKSWVWENVDGTFSDGVDYDFFLYF